MTNKDGYKPKYLFEEDNNGKKGLCTTFVGERQKKGKWKSKFSSEALQRMLVELRTVPSKIGLGLGWNWDGVGLGFALGLVEVGLWLGLG